MKPKIHLYTICWNEEDFLDFFFRHYDPFVEEYHFYDDGSDDATLKILKAHPKVHIHPFETTEDSYILSAKKLHNKFWKNSRNRADWVIITAVDELLYHPNLEDYLLKCSQKNVTAIPAIGFQMISEEYPIKGSTVTSQISSGAFFKQMNKLSLFNPQEIDETNYVGGRHQADPVGNIKYPEKDELYNLHYKYLSFEKTFERHKELNKKLRAFDKGKNWGHRYRWDKEKLIKDWNAFMADVVNNVRSKEEVKVYLQSKNLKKWWRSDNIK